MEHAGLWREGILPSLARRQARWYQITKDAPVGAREPLHKVVGATLVGRPCWPNQRPKSHQDGRPQGSPLRGAGTNQQQKSDLSRGSLEKAECLPSKGPSPSRPQRRTQRAESWGQHDRHPRRPRRPRQNLPSPRPNRRKHRHPRRREAPRPNHRPRLRLRHPRRLRHQPSRLSSTSPATIASSTTWSPASPRASSPCW